MVVVVVEEEEEEEPEEVAALCGCRLPKQSARRQQGTCGAWGVKSGGRMTGRQQGRAMAREDHTTTSGAGRG